MGGSAALKMVPGAGLEPALPKGPRILSPLRMPIPPSRHLAILLRQSEIFGTPGILKSRLDTGRVNVLDKELNEFVSKRPGLSLVMSLETMIRKCGRGYRSRELAGTEIDCFGNRRTDSKLPRRLFSDTHNHRSAARSFMRAALRLKSDYKVLGRDAFGQWRIHYRRAPASVGLK